MKCQTAIIRLFILELHVLPGILSVRPYGQRNEGCKKKESFGVVSLNCSHQNLPFIPNVDSSVETLIFGFNELSNVTAETFRNVSSPENLIGLQLDNNKIRNISSKALDVLKNLEILYLSNNPIYYYNLKNLLGSMSRLRSLREIRMSGISTILPQKDLFSLMNGSHIQNLGIEYYEMKMVSFDTFKMFTSLKTLILSNNHIQKLMLLKCISMRSLYLSNNYLESIPKFSMEGNESNCYFPYLETLDVSNNVINELNMESFECLLNLKNLDISSTRIKTISNDLFSKLPSLKFLNIWLMNGQHLRIKQFAFRSKSLETLDLGFTGYADKVFDSVDDTFKYSPHLKYLCLRHMTMSQLTTAALSKLFSPLTKLVTFKCYICKLSQDPKFILTHMNHVQRIDLRNNLITTISDETFMHNKRLKSLSLRYNQLGHIHESALPMSLLNNLYLLDISRNPFICDCDLEWLIKWMKTKSNKTVLARYPYEYKCSKPTEKQTVQLSDITFTYKECHPWSPWTWVAVIASPCVVVLGTAVLILYRNRWNIKHYIFLVRKRRNYQRIPGNVHRYDAFVAYEATDSIWVKRRLIPVLEGDAGLRLCIHERDFQAGVFINDNIVNNIEASNKIIVVLTNAFAASGWCMFELKVAHSRLIEDRTELVIILLEKIDARNMNHSLKVLFDTTTYMEWTEDAVGQELFWAKLKDVLRN